MIVCVIIFFLSLALVFIDILIRPLIKLTNLAEKMNNIDSKDPINDLIDELSKYYNLIMIDHIGFGFSDKPS